MARVMKNSGIEWIGEIPETWDIIKFKYLFSITGGNGFPENLQGQTEGTYPFCKVSDINGHSDYVDTAANYVSDEVAKEHGFNIIPCGSIIIAKIGAALQKNHRKINSVPCCIDNNTQALVPIRADNLRYLLYLTRCIDMGWFDNNSTVPSLNNNKLLNFFVPNVSVAEQQRIAAFLDRKCAEIDAVIEKTKATIEEYKKLKQSVITEAVTKGIRGNRLMKDSGIEWIGEIPEAWEIVKMKHLGKCRNGLTYSPENVCDESGTLVLRSSNIQEGKLCFDDNVYVNCQVRDELMVKKGDILICSRNGSRALIGKNALIPAGVVASFGAFMMIFRCECPEYVHLILNSAVFNYYLGTFLTATINQLTADNFNNMQIVYCPDEVERQEIVKYLEARCAGIDTLIAKKTALLTELETYKKSLIYEYVTGKKEVL